MTSNTMKHKKVHEPLFHIAKRGAIPWWKAWIIRAIAIVAALVVAAIVTLLLTGENPIEVYAKMISGSFGTPRRMWKLAQNMAMLLCVALAVTPAFKMRFWNIGAEGQVLAGGLSCAACMILLSDKLPAPLLMLVMVVSSIAAGAIWALIPAFFKAFWDTNETLFTLMMNYIATQLVAFFAMKWEARKGSGIIGIINSQSREGWLPSLAGQDYLVNVLVVVALTVAMYIYLRYSKQGYELTVVGESQNTARYIGIDVKKVVIRTMIISGAVCGIAGFLLVSGTNHTITATTAGGRGFTAIMVSWLAKFNPIYMVFTSFLLVFLQIGAGEIATAFKLNQAFADIISGIILFFIIGCEFFINYQLVGRHSGKGDK